MTFVDKLFRWKKKPFTADRGSAVGKQDGARDSKPALPAAKGSAEPQGSGKLSHILIRPHVSEKVGNLQALNQYVFAVARSATKHEIGLAVRDIYGISPLAVRIMNMRGRKVRFGRSVGATKRWKKAIITLPEGKSIDVHKK